MKEKRINMNKEISSFIDRYVKEIKNNSAAMFIGAGFSKSVGYVDWKNLLKDVADDLGNGTLERKPKKSYYWMKDVIASNGEKLWAE